MLNVHMNRWPIDYSVVFLHFLVPPTFLKQFLKKLKKKLVSHRDTFIVDLFSLNPLLEFHLEALCASVWRFQEMIELSLANSPFSFTEAPKTIFHRENPSHGPPPPPPASQYICSFKFQQQTHKTFMWIDL